MTAATWAPPAGWNLITLNKGQICVRCARTLYAGCEHLIRHTPRARGRQYQFRCVDTDDCATVTAWGGDPIYRRKLIALADRLDHLAGR